MMEKTCILFNILGKPINCKYMGHMLEPLTTIRINDGIKKNWEPENFGNKYKMLVKVR